MVASVEEPASPVDFQRSFHTMTLAIGLQPVLSVHNRDSSKTELLVIGSTALSLRPWCACQLGSR